MAAFVPSSNTRSERPLARRHTNSSRTTLLLVQGNSSSPRSGPVQPLFLKQIPSPSFCSLEHKAGVIRNSWNRWFPDTQVGRLTPDISNTGISMYFLIRKKFGHISNFYLHFSFFYLKLLIFQRKFSWTRKFTLRYQLVV